jgi:hypothetical protein
MFVIGCVSCNKFSHFRQKTTRLLATYWFWAVWQVQPGENGKEKTVLLSSVAKWSSEK